MGLLDSEPFLEQYCPHCHTPIEEKDDYWECEDCGYIITNDEIALTDGYPTFDSIFDEDEDEDEEENLIKLDLLFDDLDYILDDDDVDDIDDFDDFDDF